MSAYLYYVYLNKPLCLLKSTTERKTVAVLCTHIGCLISKETYIHGCSGYDTKLFEHLLYMLPT